MRRITVATSRGSFAALEALPVTGVCERQPALLVPGYTGSKEDFLPVLGPLAVAGRRVVAIDMRGQYESPPADADNGYRLGELGADVAAIAQALGARGDVRDSTAAPVHLLGHSLGGLVARETMLARTAGIGSLTLMSSGPGALTGPRADILQAVLASIEGTGDLAAEVRRLWDTQMEPAAVADGVPAGAIAFLRTRMLRSCPFGLRSMGEALLACPDRTQTLADLRAAPILVVYGENDDAWEPSAQEAMARQLKAQRVCIPGAAHSPAAEAPETVASTLTAFWNEVECGRARRPGLGTYPDPGADADLGTDPGLGMYPDPGADADRGTDPGLGADPGAHPDLGP